MSANLIEGCLIIRSRPVMKTLPLAFGCIALSCLVGCGGNASSATPSNGPVFFSGTITVHGVNEISSGTATIVATSAGGSSLEAYFGSSQILGTVSVSPGKGILSQGGAYLRGQSQETFGPNTVSFQIEFEGKTVAEANLSKAVLPVLGSVASVPPAGAYNGQLIAMTHGAVTGVGTLSGSVDAAGNWQAEALTTFPSDAGGIYSGSLATPASIPLLSYTSFAGYVVNQSTPAPYSFDGKTLIVRVDSISGADVAWLVMSKS